VNVSHDLLDRLDLKRAAELELTTVNRLMPHRPDRIALSEHADEVSRQLRNQYAKGQFGDLAEIIFVDKNRRGRRPISEMTLRDKVLFRALVDLIAESLPEHLVKRTPHEDFRGSPLAVERARYISKTDVSSFYEYVDHDRLSDELAAQTGEAPAIETLMELLYRMMGRRVGLPQVHHASDILGDTYIDPVRRRMRRAGFEVTTYSDDFRIASPTLGHAREALETCAREVRELGLTLNESKTFTYTSANYSVSLQAFSDAEKRLFEDSDVPAEDWGLLYIDDYSDGTDEVASETVQALAVSVAQPVFEEDMLNSAGSIDAQTIDVAQTRAAKKAWDIWADEDESEAKQSTIEAAITETLLRRALPILGRSGNEEPAESLQQLLRYEPALTPHISAYVTELGAFGPGSRTTLRRSLNEMVTKQDLSVWQKIWLAEAAGSIRPARAEHAHYAWLQECVSDPDAALAATAAVALGKLRRGEVGTLIAALDRIGPVWRSMVLWGIAQTDLQAARNAAEDKFERLLLNSLEK
jgi:hypothetical protein